MITVNLNGREIPLIYTVYEMKQIQEQISPLDKYIEIMSGKRGFANVEHLECLAKTIVIMGNAGLEEAGEEPNLTEKKVMRALKPKMIAESVSLCMDAMAEGMQSEIPEKKKDGPVDVVLEEMEKKKEPAS